MGPLKDKQFLEDLNGAGTGPASHGSAMRRGNRGQPMWFDCLCLASEGTVTSGRPGRIAVRPEGFVCVGYA